MSVKMLIIFCLCIATANAANQHDDFTFPQLSDNDVSLHKQSNSGFGLLLMHNKDQTEDFSAALHSILDASESLNKNGAIVGVLNCNESTDVLCEEKEEKLVVYKGGEFITSLDLGHLSTPETAEGNILTQLYDSTFPDISEVEVFNKVLEEAKSNKKNLLLAVTEPATPLHQYLLKTALSTDADLMFAYTQNSDLSFFLGDTGRVMNKNGELWVVMCSVETSGECPYFQYKGVMTAYGIKSLLAHMQLPYFSIQAENKNSLSAHINSGLENGRDVAILTAGAGKLERAEKLSEMLCSVSYPYSKCLFVDGQKVETPNVAIPNKIKDGRIYMSFKTQPDIEQEIVVGYLGSETLGEVEQHFQRLEQHRKILDRSLRFRYPDGDLPPSKRGPIRGSEEVDGDDENEVLVAADEDSFNEDPKYAQEVQDDAVMHAVHTNKELKDLYLYDFKSYSRLTDKTYETVTNGNEYAVILFTHEFNPKALAALSSFIGIHRTYKEGSPLHRVECFDWPDVCQKAGITTYPRMFFYRPGSDRKPIEYHGIWMQSEMENAINRHALPWPRIITKEKELETMKPHSRPVVCGLIVTDQGEKIFTEAAQQLGSDYEVIMFKKLALNAIKSYVKAKNWDGKSDLVAVNIKHKFLPHTQTFTSVDEVKQGVATALEQKWTEMTVVNFQKLMSAPEPLVIQYVDKSANKKVERDLTDAFKKIANSKEFDGKIIFTWMDSSPNTPGEYALNIHSGGKWEGAPIVFFDKKGSVMFRDVINAENKSAQWLTDCLAGKIEATYKLRDEEWKGRLPGYDLLQIMKDEGTYPVFPKKEVEEKQETVPRGPVHSGKQKKVVPQEPKEEGNQPKHTEL